MSNDREEARRDYLEEHLVATASMDDTIRTVLAETVATGRLAIILAAGFNALLFWMLPSPVFGFGVQTAILAAILGYVALFLEQDARGCDRKKAADTALSVHASRIGTMASAQAAASAAACAGRQAERRWQIARALQLLALICVLISAACPLYGLILLSSQ